MLLDKPPGPTSCQLVRWVRGQLGTRHVGHVGTLDPFASGLVPIAVGGAARLSDAVHSLAKEYEWTMVFGQETDTGDCQGRVVEESPVPEDLGRVLAACIPSFIGRIPQVPPAYSALKHKGVPLYAYMRATGSLPLDLATKCREVEVFDLTLEGLSGRHGRFRVRCGAGTYVRALARDLALACGTRGTCTQLRRTEMGGWRVEDSHSLEYTPQGLVSAVPAASLLQTPEAMVPHLPLIDLGTEWEARVLSGNRFALPGNHPEHPKSPALVRAGSALFQCEIESISGVPGAWVQPRRRIR